jgi:glycine dehydrogenase
MGYTNTIMPPVIARNVFENPAWYTAYTPYQPEISQGRLEALLNFQTMVAELTGLDIANASLLDEATAAAEAMTMARRLVRGASNRFFVHHDTHPQTIAVLTTRAEPVGIELVVGDVDALAEGTWCGALFSYPTSTGSVTDWTAAIEAVHSAGGLAIVATDLLACVIVTPPGQIGADIVVGSAQRFGVPMGFGGPHAGFIAAGESAARALPGRLVGVSTDTAGRPALRLALQTREQHIRREKATSNICTAQVLLANIAGLYAAWHGPEGLARIAERVHRLTSTIAAGLRAAGLRLRHDTWFDTVVVDGVDAHSVMRAALDLDLNLRLISDDAVGLTLDETSTSEVVDRVLAAFGAPAAAATGGDEIGELDVGLPSECRRADEFLTQTVFSRYHSEHEMLRYLRRLADKDLALDRTMIPLGSCTMKLNATTEMVPVSWPEFTDIHPYAPADQTTGYLLLIADLERRLAEITGYDAVSLQPNAGSQGEFAGLLAIRAYHRSRGDAQRTVCLIPSSAHGTNAASAVMAGFDVVVVACDDQGNIDDTDLAAKIAAAAERLGAIMVTYPSTHGVFEEGIIELCRAVHDAGGQVYVDGANLNALVGVARPGSFGADVSHLNLHKTFCIPHGGGGPGVGPIGVRAHLAEFLPGDPLAARRHVGPVAAARFGSAGILPIPLAYLSLMGPAGLTRATHVAIAAANYLATRLAADYPVLYTGAHGRVAHECIIDLRPITRACGVTVDDVAKRLIDYGFHAPTMSFPVAGTLMIEPTESEDLRELDRFCDAMTAIRDEIRRVESGEWTVDESPLRNAPHTAEDVTGDWDRPYPRQLGIYPVDALRSSKYFPPVSRIDSAYGDRNLVCSCEPLEAYAQ